MPWKPASIPVVSPVTAYKISASGRNQPIQMRCENGKSTDDYFVKLWNNLELKEHSLAREIYGSLLADYFKLATPDIALVDIPQDFHLCESNLQIKQFLQNSPGLNFGSKNVNGAIIFSPPAPPSLISLAARVFCFDMLICNADRSSRVNMFNNANGLMLFDHELAFPFSRPRMFIGGFPRSGAYIRESWSKEHILYSSLKCRDLTNEIDEFMSDLASLNNSILVTIEKSIPQQWQADLKNISEYLADIRDNPKNFKRNLQELLV